ncbi:MAG: isocitrate lyase/phosphoenolpyruvate mutase family protein [Dehalococcoidia bacterium]|nr:isocitrate lyase/phosphoenolpyruvate mutase family protein [Dehalococcoidia bacterium]
MRITTKFRQLLNQPGIIQAPGAYDCLTAKLIQQAGFPAVYMTGAGTSVAQLGYPDLGLATMTDMIANAGSIADILDVPLIADADTGYGGILNIRRTIRQYERAGVAAVHIEDQEMPKRCGHLDDKKVVSVQDMVQKIRAAVDARTDDDFTIIVRTDSIAVTGWEDAMHRCEQYMKAGADALFVEALRTPEEVEQVAKNLDIPLLYNFVESGKSPLLSAEDLEKFGFKIVIYPASALLSVTHIVEQVMAQLKETGTTAHLMDKMVTLEACFEAVGLSSMLAEDAQFASPV